MVPTTLTGHLQATDPLALAILREENKRQEETLEMIASENFVSPSVLEACSSTLTNKYAEGYPGKRYYNGCECSDKIENLAIERAKKLFNANFVNVQAHSGSQANQAAFFSFLQLQDTILGMDLSHGGHLTHGARVNLSGRCFRAVSYGVRETDQRIDFDQMAKIAKEYRPKLIIAGFSAYSRELDFAKFRQIADDVKAVLLADVAHIAGLIAVGEHPNPVGIADVVTSTTHKTLRGPRGGLILSHKEEYAKRIDSQVFPGLQGGPFMHIIAAKAVAFQEALQPEFRSYIRQVKANASVLADSFMQQQLDVVTGGTENHIVLLDLRKTGLTGATVADTLHKVGITANKNGVPFDPHPPRVTSGVRLGSAALTTRGLGCDEFSRIGTLIGKLIKNLDDEKTHAKIREEVNELTSNFPMDSFRL